jgi:hypothetical protein
MTRAKLFHVRLAVERKSIPNWFFEWYERSPQPAHFRQNHSSFAGRLGSSQQEACDHDYGSVSQRTVRTGYSLYFLYHGADEGLRQPAH